MATPRHHDSDKAEAMGQLLHRLRRRCRKLSRLASNKPGGPEWAQWSDAVDERNALFVEIAAIPLKTLLDVAIRYEAVATELIDEDLILDDAARRRVTLLRRDLRKLASR